MDSDHSTIRNETNILYKMHATWPPIFFFIHQSPSAIASREKIENTVRARNKKRNNNNTQLNLINLRSSFIYVFSLSLSSYSLIRSFSCSFIHSLRCAYVRHFSFCTTWNVVQVSFSYRICCSAPNMEERNWTTEQILFE